MGRMDPFRRTALAVMAAAALTVAGCTGPLEYVRNGFKVGPNYSPAPAPVSAHWIDASDVQLRSDPANMARWWCVFNDPTLNNLVDFACRQNLSLRQAAFRVLEARAQLAIARGELFPQSQTASGGYHRIAYPALGTPVPLPAPLFFDQWNYGFNLAWELDFWGRLRRAIIANEDNLDASVANYDQAMVTMLGDIAQNYVQVRTDQERIALLRSSVELQRGVLSFIEARFQVGFKVSELDYDQAKSNLAQTEAQILPLEIDARQASNRLCTLLGIPPMDLQNLLGTGADPDRAAGRGRRHPLRFAPSASGRAAGGAAGGRPGRANRHRRGPVVSDLLHHRHDQLAGREPSRPVHLQQRSTATSVRSSNGTSSTTAASAAT